MAQAKKEGQLDEQTYIKNTKSMQKMQEITDRLTLTTPQLTNYVNPESILKPSKMLNEQTLQPLNKKSELLEAQKKQKKAQPTSQQITNKNEMTPLDWQKKCVELEMQLNEVKDKNNLLIIDLNNRKERFVKREIEYRKIIDELQQELRQKTTLDQGDKKLMENIYKDHSKIVEGINSIQLRTSKILVDQERDIIRFFNNKINEIKKQFEEERIKKGKKDQDYIEKENQLISELEWIKNIAQKIDNENHNLMKKYVDLKAQYQTQENDREMLLKELIMKKKKNAILKSQIEQYEKLLNEVQKEGTDNEDEDEVQSQDKKAQIRIRPISNKKGEMSKSMRSQRSQEESASRNASYVNHDMMQSSQQFKTQVQRYQKTIKSLQSTLKKEQLRVRDLKSKYIKQIQTKSELEKILRKCVEDIKEEIIQLRGEARVYGKNKQREDEFDRQERDKLIERLLNNEKILTLLYDKTFYPELKQVDMQSEDMDNDVEQQYEENFEDEKIEDQF